MAGRENHSEGVPSGGGDDEFRAVEFDESFIRAAQLEEFSAQERMSDHAQAVRRRPVVPAGGATSRQGVVLLVLITLAFGTAIYLGMRDPYQPAPPLPPEPLRTALVSLTPSAAVPGGAPEKLVQHSPAATFRVGADGVTLPAAHRTKSFTEQQVLAALVAAKEYIVKSSLDPEIVTGGGARPVRLLLDPRQHAQFDRSLAQPVTDGRHAATGWMVRLDPQRVALADPEVRVDGTLEITEMNANTLEITADHVFVYAVRPQGPVTDDGASLFTVRRELRMHVDRNDLREQQLELRTVTMQAGPLNCDAKPASALRPLLAGERASADGETGTDPYADGPANASLCGTLPDEAMPTPPTGSRVDG